LGHNFLIYWSGEIQTGGGTSAADPTIVGIISTFNTARLANGQKKIGFANPFLYQMHAENPKAFNDIVSGDNICTGEFKAYKGWDPVTGLGTPNVEEMVKYIKSHAHNQEHN
jgi:tripeptidyl-peptidase-1